MSKKCYLCAMVMSQVKKCLLLIFCMTFSLFVQAQELDSLIFNTIVTDLHTVDSLYAEHNDTAVVDSIILAERPYRIDTLCSYWVPLVDSLICYAESYYGCPYHYGSKGPNSFDCSGFTSGHGTILMVQLVRQPPILLMKVGCSLQSST